MSIIRPAVGEPTIEELIGSRTEEPWQHHLRLPPGQLPTRLHSMDQVKRWHTIRVLRDSTTYQEAAIRLGVSKKTLWEWRDRMDISDYELASNFGV